MQTKRRFALLEAKNKRTKMHLIKLKLPQVNELPHHNWMKDWMEQADNFKNHPEAAAMISNNIDGFLHYADKLEGHYV